MPPSMFPFFKLPGELRIKIYKFVLGGHLLHVYRDTQPGRHEPTVFRCSEHRDICGLEVHTNFYLCRRWAGKLDVAVLRVCRQIYQEASVIPLTTNTFKFNDSEALMHFFTSMPMGQINLIRSLQLEPTLLYRGDVNAWARSRFVADAFLGLKELIIHAHLKAAELGRTEKPWSSRWTEAFWSFNRLDLERVKVTVDVSIIDEDTEDEDASDGEASDGEASDEELEEDMDEETEDDIEEAHLREMGEGLRKKLLRLE